jgi:hypothetical protein
MGEESPSKKKTSLNKQEPKRLNRYRREKSKAPNIVLQPRDVAILVAVNDYLGFLTREQIQQLFFGNQSPFESTRKKSDGLKTACNRLKLLFHNGYLDRYAPARERQGIVDYHDLTARLYAPRPFVYFLTEQGARIVSEAKGIPFQEANFKRKFKERDEARIFHEMTINDFRITLVLAAQKYKEDLEILEWKGEQDCYQTYNVKDNKTGRWHRKIFRPDAFFKLRIHGQVISSFLEVDTGTESHSKRILEKVDRYKEYSKEGYFRNRYGEEKFRVLMLTTRTEDRIVNMKSTIEEVVKGVFWFSTRDGMIYNLDFLFEPLWLKAGDVDHLAFYVPCIGRYNHNKKL